MTDSLTDNFKSRDASASNKKIQQNPYNHLWASWLHLDWTLVFVILLSRIFFLNNSPKYYQKIFNTKHSYWYIALLKSASNLDRTSHMGRPLRDPGISRDPGIFSKSWSRDSQKSNPGIFWDFQKPFLKDCILKLSTPFIDHINAFWDLWSLQEGQK